MPFYRDKKTGEFVSEETYNRSMAHGGTRYEEVQSEVPENPDYIFDSKEAIFDLYDDAIDYSDFEEYIFDGGAEYGEE